VAGFEVATTGRFWVATGAYSIKEKFEQKYPQGFWCDDDKSLIEAIHEITRWK